MIALVLVIVLMLVLGILAYAFFQFGGDVRRQLHNSYVGERALNLARGAVDEAINDLQTRVNTVDPDVPESEQLYKIVREAKASHPISWKFKPKLTTQVADIDAQVSKVEVVVQRFRQGPTRPRAIDVKKLSPELKERIKRGWEEFYRTGYCGPDMDIAFSLSSESVVGMASFRVKTAIPTDRSAIVRELEVRRTLNHAIHSYTGTQDILKELGVLPPTGKPSPFGSIVPASSGSSSEATGTTTASPGGFESDDVHLSPYDSLRVVWRSEESSTW